MINPRGGDFSLATNGDRNLAIDKCPGARILRQNGGFARVLSELFHCSE